MNELRGVPESAREMRVTGLITPGENDRWRISQFEVDDSRDQIIQFGSYMRTGRICPPGTYTRLTRDRTLVMTDTPDELRDHFYVTNAARTLLAETVLINGLGLGCVLKGVLQYPSVQHVDVVEADLKLITLMLDHAPWLSDWRVEIHWADAYEKKWERGRKWDVVWHDVWDDLCTDNLSDGYATLNRKYGQRARWQGAWQQEWLKMMRKRGY